jgi:endonuclease I
MVGVKLSEKGEIMKKLKYYVGIVVAIAVGVLYVSQSMFGIDLLGTVIPDTEAPVIDLSTLRETITIGMEYDTSNVTCTDNRDFDCEVEFGNVIDTSSEGVQTLIITATDLAGNTKTMTFLINVIAGLDTTMYVPNGYYDGISDLSGEALKAALNDIITNHTEFPYTDSDIDDMDVWKMLREADEDPDNPDNVILFYSGYSWPKECQDTNTDLLPDYCFENNDREADYTEWNREHIWSKSHGDFEDEDGYLYEDSFGGYALGAHTDGHHLVAAERAMNSTKNNRFFDDCHDGVNDDDLVDRGFGNYTCGDWYFEPRDEVKGDVARMLFYMVIRYEGEEGDFVDLELTNDLYKYEDLEIAIKNSKLPYYENLSVLLRWHLEDPVDEWELERNESIYQIQGNRNPFIDHPELVELIWGTADNPVEYTSTTE